MVTLWLLIRIALEKCFCWLDEESWRLKKWQELENRSQEEDTRFECSRMKCSRSSNNVQDKWGEYTVYFIHGNLISVQNLQSVSQKLSWNIVSWSSSTKLVPMLRKLDYFINCCYFRVDFSAEILCQIKNDLMTVFPARHVIHSSCSSYLRDHPTD